LSLAASLFTRFKSHSLGRGECEQDIFSVERRYKYQPEGMSLFVCQIRVYRSD